MATIDGGLDETSAAPQSSVFNSQGQSTARDRTAQTPTARKPMTHEPTAHEPITHARGRPYAREVSWRLFALVGASVAAGAAVGAAIALLTAPQSGGHTRLALARELRRHRPWDRSPWDKLGDNLNDLVERRNKRLHRQRV